MDATKSEKVLIQHSDEGEAAGTFVNVVKAGSVGSSWMGVYAEIQEDGTIKLFRTTWNFPKERFSEVVNLLKDALSKEAVIQDEPVMLPLSHYLSLQEELRKRKSQFENSAAPSTVINPPRRDDDPIHVSIEDEVTDSSKEEC